MRSIIYILMGLCFHRAGGQITEDFSDGDFADGSPLTWISSQVSGSNDFIISSGEVRSNGPSSAAEIYFSTSIAVDFSTNDVQWRFKTRYTGGSPSGSNFVEFYLMSNQSDLVTDPPIGYYVRMGEGGSGDGIDLYKTTSGTPIISDESDLVAADLDAHVKVTRRHDGHWTLEADNMGGDNFTVIGNMTDTEISSGSNFGLIVNHTSTRKSSFFLDDVVVTITPVTDTSSPTIQSITIDSDTQMEVRFSENVDQTTSETFSNYSLNNGIKITHAERDAVDLALVVLTTDALTNGTSYTITINNVEDENGNVIAANSQSSFQYLVFEEAEAFDVVINEFMPDPNPVAVDLPDAEFVELYNRSDKFFNLEDWMLDGEVLGVFTMTPGAYIIVVDDDDKDLFNSYSNVISIPALTLNNSGEDFITLQDDHGLSVHSISFTGSEGGISTELINPNGPDYSENNYGLSVDPSGGTPGQQNSIFDDTPDSSPPFITDIAAISATELDVTFNERVEITSAEIITNYTVDGGISVLGAVLSDLNRALVHLTVSELVSGEVRTLTVKGVSDLSGNVAANETGLFEYIETEEASEGDLVINEFLAQPSDESGIPNAEFVEVLNNSLKFIQLEDWKLNDAVSASGTFDSYVIRPGGYLILTEAGNGELFAGLGEVMEVIGFPSLNNSGDAISVQNSSEVTIAQIAYSFSEPGVSLELINPNGPDYSENNYGLSVDPSGGTPGQQNSIFDDTPDSSPPFITDIAAISATELDVTFNEMVEITSAEITTNYTVDGGISVLGAVLSDLNRALVHLTVSELVSGEVRTLTVKGVSDLSGNVAANETGLFEYIETEEASEGDLVINEFLAQPSDESGIPNAEFVEVLNNSLKFIQLENWKLNDAVSASGAFGSYVIRPGGYLILTEAGNGELFTGLGEVMEVVGFPSLNNSGDAISVQNSSEVMIAQIAYSFSEPGVSLELINPNDPCLSSVSYKLSVDPSGGTPGNQNSIFDDTPDTVSPTISSFGFSSSLMINFSESMDATSLKTGSYTIENLIVENIIVQDDFPTSVELIFTEEIALGVMYEMTVADVTDCAGNGIRETTFAFSVGRSPEFNEIIITEIMFDEVPAIGLPEREFIEIYNSTDQVLTTSNMQFSDATGTINLPLFNLEPQTYYLLTSTLGASEFPINAVGVTGFPSLNNSGEQLVFSLGKKLIFSLEYNPNWHEEEKKGGGYSLEMMDITNPCVEDNNWFSSLNSNGGTPGTVNSVSEVIPDNSNPELISVIAISPDTVRIVFNEKINPHSISRTIAQFQPLLTVSEFYFDIFQPKKLFIILDQNMEENLAYTIQLTKVSDCNGNEVQSSNFTFALPSIANKEEVKLSEVLFNPRTNGVDFIEVFNDSDRYLSLKNWKLARITQKGIADERIITDEELVLEPNEYLAFTTDANVLLNNYPGGHFDQFFEVASLPVYANDTGNVILLNDRSMVQEQFFYDEDFHYDLLENVDGVSLERVSFSSDVDDSNSWRSAASSEGFATPGFANSQSLNSVSALGNLSVEPKVFIPGNNGAGRDFTLISYQFNRPGQFANVTIYDQTGRLVKTLVQGVLLANSGFLRWDGITDNGRMARLGYYVVVFEVYDSLGNTEVIKETVAVGRNF